MREIIAELEEEIAWCRDHYDSTFRLTGGIGLSNLQERVRLLSEALTLIEIAEANY